MSASWTTSWDDTVMTYQLNWTAGASSELDVKAALPYDFDGVEIKTGKLPTPLVAIANASTVFNVTSLSSLNDAAFAYGGFDNTTRFTMEFRPRVGELLVVNGQGLSLTVTPKPDCCASTNGYIQVKAELIGDFCKRVPAESVCESHNAQATAPPPGQPAHGSSGASPNNNTDTTAKPPQNESVVANATTTAPRTAKPTETKSISARRIVVSTVVACLALVSTTVL